MQRRLRLAVACAVTVGLAVTLVPAGTAQDKSHVDIFPTTINLPDGFQPEGIAIGAAPIAYFGSLVTGDLFRVNLVTGRGSVFSTGPGTASVGMKVDHRARLFVAGGAAGDGRVVSAITGQVLASYQFTTLTSFVDSSAAALRTFSDNSASIQDTLSLLPGALKDTQAGLGKLAAFADIAGPTLDKLKPTSENLADGMAAANPMLKETTPIINDEISPFALTAKPFFDQLVPAVDDLIPFTESATHAFDYFNQFLNADVRGPLAMD